MKKLMKNALCLSSLFFGLISVSNASLIVTSNQSVDVSGKFLPANPPNVADPRQDFSNSFNGSNTGGSSEFDFALSDKGIDEGSVHWDISIEQGRLKTLSDLQVQHDFSNGPQFTNLSVDVNSSISYGDTITVRDLNGDQNPIPSNLYVRFQVDLTGNLFNTVNYDNPENGGASTANYTTQASFFSRIANSGGDANQDWQLEETSSTHSNGIFGSNVDETATLNSSVVFEDLLWSHQAIFFDWTYSEMFKVDIENIDIGSIYIQMKNDLSNTIITRASVFDASGNWLPNYVVESSGGFDYGQLLNTPPTTPVHAPAIMILFLLSVMAMAVKRSTNAT